VPRRAALWTGIDLDWTMPSTICTLQDSNDPSLIRLSASEAPLPAYHRFVKTMMMENERNRQMQNRRVWELLKDSDVAIQVLLFGAGKEQKPYATWHQSPATIEALPYHQQQTTF
jgi:hypothetical protein